MDNRNRWREVKDRNELRVSLLSNIKNVQIARGTLKDCAALDQAMKDKHSKETSRIFQRVAPHLEVILTTLESYNEHFEWRAEDKEKTAYKAVLKLREIERESELLQEVLHAILIDPEEKLNEFYSGSRDRFPIARLEDIFKLLIDLANIPYFAGVVQPEEIEKLEKASKECEKKSHPAPQSHRKYCCNIGDSTASRSNTERNLTDASTQTVITIPGSDTRFNARGHDEHIHTFYGPRVPEAGQSDNMGSAYEGNSDFDVSVFDADFRYYPPVPGDDQCSKTGSAPKVNSDFDVSVFDADFVWHDESHSKD